MAKYVFYEAHLCEYYNELIQFNKAQRGMIQNGSTLAAVNMSLILNTACFLEGILEDRGNLLLGYYNTVYKCIHVKEFGVRKSFNTIHHNISSFIHHKISQTIGLDNYDSLFKLFLHKSFRQDEIIKQLIEGVNVLFQLRNVIAHGRQAYAYEVEAYYTDGIEEHFMGGYKKAEEYLLKKKLMEQKFLEAENLDIYFTNEIADHFLDVVQEFIKELDRFISENLLISDALMEELKKYNERNETKMTIYDFFRTNGVSI